MRYHIYTDGSCKGNPGPGGWCMIVTDEADRLIDIKAEFTNNTTNNREEIKPILYAMEHYGQESTYPIVYTDSSYCFNTFTKWIFLWAAKGWVKSNMGKIKNLDLIKQYYELFTMNYRITLRHIRGHHDIYWNEVADKVAKGVMSIKEVKDFHA